MDKCSSDILIDFFCVTFHCILFHCKVYPATIFEKRKKYNLVVYRSIHPEVNAYIEGSLKNIYFLLVSGALDKVVFCLINEAGKVLANFVFDITKHSNIDISKDPYLIQCEQNLRKYLLRLSTLCDSLKILGTDVSFKILLYTNESSAVSLSVNAELEDFPFVEIEELQEKDFKIIPINCLEFKGSQIEMYIEN